MSRAAYAFSFTAIAPVFLIGAACVFGGAWGWVALAYLTVFAFAVDELIGWVGDESTEFPAAEAFTVILGLSHFVVLFGVVWAVSEPFAVSAKVALFLSAGLFLGQISNSNAHELVHKQSRALRMLGRLVYASIFVGHHASAHLLIHHKFVATEHDPNTAKAGEGFYRYLKRAWIGAFIAGLDAENLRRKNRAIYHHPYILDAVGSACALLTAYTIGGMLGLCTLIVLAAFAQLQLLLADYVQHYGLTRKMIGEKYEPVGDVHSWNAPHMFTSHMMLHAPRHSAHHTKPSLGFTELGLPDRQDAPYLPYSLPVMSLIALAPIFWRRIMDPRLAFWQAERIG